MAKVYHLENIAFESGDVVIDCGANVGEIGMFLSRYNVDYHAFEPSSEETSCARYNNGSGKVTNKALWHSSGQITLYNKNDTGDSSLFEIEDYQSKVIVDTIALDEYVENNNIDRIKLLKLEAEGAEPEILEGANETLKRIYYVSVDCGFERGSQSESTLPAVTNKLLHRGFKAVAVSRRRLVVLFENENISVS